MAPWSRPRSANSRTDAESSTPKIRLMAKASSFGLFGPARPRARRTSNSHSRMTGAKRGKSTGSLTRRGSTTSLTKRAELCCGQLPGNDPCHEKFARHARRRPVGHGHQGQHFFDLGALVWDFPGSPNNILSATVNWSVLLANSAGTEGGHVSPPLAV